MRFMIFGDGGTVPAKEKLIETNWLHYRAIISEHGIQSHGNGSHASVLGLLLFGLPTHRFTNL